MFKSFTEYSGFNNSQEKHDFPCIKVHGNKNQNLVALKTFKASFNIDVHLNFSNTYKTKPNIFFFKKEKEVKINNI